MIPFRLRLLLPVFVCAALVARPGDLAAESTDLPGLDGGRLTAEEVESGAVILVFWASWSPRCRDIVIRVNALERRWSPVARVATVVFQEEPDAVREFLAGKDIAAPVYLDATGSFSKRHAVATLPALVVLRDGQVDFRGKLPVDPDAVIERVLG